jgi:assimilatory nitrate reductase catalytic subunit
VEWDVALDQVAGGFRRVIDEHGPDAVAMYVSGQLLTEDYYVANKLMKGYIGSANIDTNSRLCMSSAVAAHTRAFGEDLVPVDYKDLDLADLVVLVGSNAAWCHPVLYQRLRRAKERRPGMKIVVVDPRITATCDIADLHLALRPGTDVVLFNGLLGYLHRHGVVDTRFVQLHTSGLERALLVADNTAGSTAAVAKLCALPLDTVEEFYRLFACTERVVTAFSQGVNQSSQGTDKANSLINCHLLTGRIGRAGMGPLSLTGQPNAMGGREVGGLANMLAAHMSLENADHRGAVQGFWQSPRIAATPGLKAVELFNAIHAGKVKAVWIMATNPVVSLPDANKVRAALERCELVVVSDCVAQTDTTLLAHVLLPATSWGEKDGTVTNSERCISRQRAFLPAPGEAKPDWWTICEVARRMGYTTGFNYSAPHEIFTEHARLTSTANDGRRALDLGALAGLDATAFEALEPVQWPLARMKTALVPPQETTTPLQQPAPVEPHARPEIRLFEDGRFFHADRKARFIATRPRAPGHALDEEYPLVLNTGRIRDQWHTMTRTGLSSRLAAHTPEPYVDMHAQDALLAGVREGELVRVSTRWGSLVARLRLSGDIPRRQIFVPIHWSGMFASDARVGALVNPVVDPISGEPEFKHTPARVAPFIVAWQGFALSRRPLPLANATSWTLTQGAEVLRYEFAGRRSPGNWSPWARQLLGVTVDETDWLEFFDAGTRVYRAAHIVSDRVDALVFISPRPDLPSRSWLSSLFARPVLDDADRAGLLAGRPTDSRRDTGAAVCSCFGVGRNTICEAIRRDALDTIEAIGRKLRAGTNCGSCISELKGLLVAAREASVAV